MEEKKLRILIVEDDFLARFGLVKMMNEFGPVDVAVNGEEAVAFVKKGYEEGAPYDLVLLDIMMPVMSGQDALQAIRRHEEEIGIIGTGGVKVIMTTALSDARSIMTAFRGQCEAYVTKPYVKKGIVDQMKKIGLLA